MTTLRPLGHRILIQPDQPDTESAAGLVLPESRDHVPVSGTVIAVGNGPARDARIRKATITRCMGIIDELAEMGVRDPQEYRAELERYRQQAERFPSDIAVGDRVVYPIEAGLTLTEDGATYIVINEDDAVVIVPEATAQQEAA